MRPFGGVGSEVLTARAKYWESCSYALNPQWASSYEPGTFYCTADEGFTFDGGLHWIRPLRMFLGEVVTIAATTGRALKHMKGASLASAIFEFESGASAVRLCFAKSAISSDFSLDGVCTCLTDSRSVHFFVHDVGIRVCSRAGCH